MHLSDKLTRIDQTLIGDHSKLNPSDECYFWLEYTSGKPFSFGRGNQLVSNLKKKPSSSNQYELGYKTKAIDECSTFFRAAVSTEWMAEATLVPMPGSKTPGHPDFDNRMTRIINGITPAATQRLRPLVRFKTSIPASHECEPGKRPSVEELIQNMEIAEEYANPNPVRIGVFDDVITAGVHFRAISTVLNARFPGVPVVGIFVARRVFAHDDFDVEEL